MLLLAIQFFYSLALIYLLLVLAALLLLLFLLPLADYLRVRNENMFVLDLAGGLFLLTSPSSIVCRAHKHTYTHWNIQA